MSEPLFRFQGVHGSRGGYWREPMARREAERVIAAMLWQDRAGEPVETPWLAQQRKIFDADDLSEAGWCVIFAEAAEELARQALAPLLEQRRAAASDASPTRYRELTYHPGETADELRGRFKVVPGRFDPDRLPYYLLLVGSPEQIPFSVQHQLAVQHAVGRVCFESPDELAHYAASVVAHECATSQRSRHSCFFGVINDDDHLSRLCAETLVSPLARLVVEEWSETWSADEVLGARATRDRLRRLLGGDLTPALLFTGGHGLCFDADDPRQRDRQGALVCADWPGPIRNGGMIARQHYLGGDDLLPEADLSGCIAFMLACFSAGTPELDSFRDPRDGAVRIARAPFAASLPSRLLSAPAGGALAVVGHVDTAFEHSFCWRDDDSQIETYMDALRELLAGRPVGLAISYFGERYAAIAAQLALARHEYRSLGREADKSWLSWLWTAQHDASRFVIVGDPAVRLDTGCEPHGTTLSRSSR